MKLVGANPKAEVTGVDELPGKANYFRGNDPKQWQTGISTYRKAKIHQAYPGIDLVYYGNPQQMEYDFVVAPGADPKQIRWVFDASRAFKAKPKIDKSGDLILKTAGGEMRLRKPVVYQDINGERKAIDGRFTVDKAQVSFQLAQYDRSRPLVIDPVLVYSTYLGSSGDNNGLGIAVDGSGNTYVTGSTLSSYFPTVNAKYPKLLGLGDAFVFKLSSDGQTVLYSTYLGGSSWEFGWGIAVDGSGNAYVTGSTGSGFPTSTNDS
jgi:hypothetical protein